MANNTSALDGKSAVPNKLLNSDGTVTDLMGNAVTNPVPAYKNKPAIPNKFLNADGTYSTLSDIIGGAIGTDLFIIVEELPATGEPNKIYLVPKTGGGFTEWAYNDGEWDTIGELEIDLSNYYDKSQTDMLLSSKVNKTGDVMTGGLVLPNLTVGARKDGSAIGENSTVEGVENVASGKYAHAEGGVIEASVSSASIDVTINKSDITLILTHSSAATGDYIRYNDAEYEILTSVELVSKTTYEITLKNNPFNTSGTYPVNYIHYSMLYNTATGTGSHAEGARTVSSGSNSHAEGRHTESIGSHSHAEGSITTASGTGSHAEGENTTASGAYAHAEGYNTIAKGQYQHAAGKNNIEDQNTYVHIVGNGTNGLNRSNAHTLGWDGTAWFAGDVYVSSTSGTNKDAGSKKLATEKYVDDVIAESITDVLEGEY